MTIFRQYEVSRRNRLAHLEHWNVYDVLKINILVNLPNKIDEAAAKYSSNDTQTYELLVLQRVGNTRTRTEKVYQIAI